ncbi:rhombosortase [Microbulbifer yueqingensis]|uniref:Rhomboid family GlyGly-CTERM serine protease n=1 Tax=Microbulbifer yueqingensis TaxID=658219 RepID=A0A1G8VAD8_9GAMM|nr:rhombosortase [Microbulbifer yueqingensis]SDJ63082.1 rhomboid family GlyGly-CTERM serine protease [Microbulbifer yueqingensis]
MTMRSLIEKLNFRAGPLLLLALPCLAFYYSSELDPLLRYERSLVLSGEYWRLISGHFTHTNLNHLLLNLAGLLLYWILFPNQRPVHRLLLEVLLLAALCGLTLVIFEPRIDWYMGLSGLLHALLAQGAVQEIAERDTRWRGLVLLVILGVKVYSEHFGTEGSLVAQWIAAPVIHEAHLWGLACGVLAGLAVVLGTRLGQLLVDATGTLRR